jgi:hypothetical protein
MNKQLLIYILCMSSFMAFAKAPEITTTCKLEESSRAGKSERTVLKFASLSENSNQSLAIKPKMALDSQAIYLLNLSLGEEYKDATNEVVGADYYLTLLRVQDDSRGAVEPKIQGNKQAIVRIEAKDTFDAQVSYVDRRGRTIYKTPKKITLRYNLPGKKKIKLDCDIISIR